MGNFLVFISVNGQIKYMYRDLSVVYLTTDSTDIRTEKLFLVNLISVLWLHFLKCIFFLMLRFFYNTTATTTIKGFRIYFIILFIIHHFPNKRSLLQSTHILSLIRREKINLLQIKTDPLVCRVFSQISFIIATSLTS